jgi:hypothetical protein
MPASTGVAGGWSTFQDMQILQVGIDLIDQTTASNCPNTIFGGTGTNTIISTAGITDQYVLAQLQTIQTVYGIKDLPYLYGLTSIFSYSDPQKHLAAWLNPSIWDPMAPATTGTDTPVNLRLNTYGEAVFIWNYWGDILTVTKPSAVAGTYYGPTTNGSWFNSTTTLNNIGPYGNSTYGYCYHVPSAAAGWPPTPTTFLGNGTNAGASRTDGIITFPRSIINDGALPGARTQPVMLDSVNAPGQNALRMASYGAISSTPANYNFTTSHTLNPNADGGYPVGVLIPGDTSDPATVVYNDPNFGATGTYVGSFYSGSTLIYTGTVTGLRTTGSFSLYVIGEIFGGILTYSPAANSPTITFTLEYQDPSDGTWRPYCRLAKTEIANGELLNSNIHNPSYFATPFYSGTEGAAKEIHIDPRTDRFSASQLLYSWQGYSAYNVDLSRSIRPNVSGTYTVENWPASTLSGSCGNPGGFYYNYLNPQNSWLLYNNDLSDLFRNLPSLALTVPAVNLSGTDNAFYSDPDGVVRPADGALADLSSGNGCPIYTGTNTHPTISRPIVLNRPFRSVAEMGYAFRDTPFASLDFAPPTSVADSADTALLDLFAVNDSGPVIAGNVNINSAPPPVIQSILSGAPEDDTVALFDTLSPVEASTIATSLLTGTLSNLLSWTGTSKASISAPFQNRADIAFPLSHWLQLATSNWNLEVANKNCRETPIRALASSADTRTWTLLVDVVAQSGSLPAAGSGASFALQGESRYWLQLAIDRYTGQVLGSTLEQVPTGPVAIGFASTSSTSLQVTDNQPPGSPLATFAAADSGSNTLTYSLVSGSGSNDNASFTISGNTLQASGVLQYLTQASYQILVQVTDQNGKTFQQPLTITLKPGSYTQWKIANFSTNAANPAIAGDTTSPAGDAIPNLVKYALGLSPIQSGTLPVTAAVSGTLMTLSYPRADAATDATVHAWWSNDLHNWTTTGVTETMLSDNGSIQLWQATTPINSQSPTQFMRLKVTSP